jgi:serine phosphatase RsbU (regulator of sigma subunit)
MVGVVTTRKSDRSGVVAPLDVKTLLASVEAAPPIDAAEVVAAALTDALGARDVSFLIADYSGRSLIRLSHVRRTDADDDGGRERGQAVALAGTPHGRALTEQDVQIVRDSDGFRVFAPVTSRGEAVGVLELGLDAEPDEQTLATVSAGAHALAYIVIANRRFTDLFDWGQRSVPLSLEAELQHQLLPSSYTCEGGQFTLAGWLEAAGGVGGDTFDFSVERDTLHLSITDAIGHTLNAAVLATVLVGALRNARRRGVNLAEQTRLANEALYGFADEGDFVTGQVVRVDHASGVARIVNAAHPSPILIREARAETVALAPDLPFGVSLDYTHRVQELQLEVGDRLVFLTDGLLERNAANVNVMEIVTKTRHLHPREAVQALTQAVVEACGGDLRDDATVLCVDWHGGPRGERDASSGADQ